ncbi:AMIN-like domain-containing (lipo)protein [Couchioplanes azureus]|uniref:AMIN-like domain-containing (lipo)protein n=1 Tax=Couchioplanes caeruleus TaxID=56438 RepID=UPI001670DBC7|nr:hypothetical protein [Couchioplanes caeruleus]GGQ49948.1 hypothetical protein GCM10010166_18050 [Couchioplanes caeruleus subsp. azureus]
MRRLRSITVLIVLLALTGAGSAGATASRPTHRPVAAAAPYCGITWGSLPKAGGTHSVASLLRVTTSRQECYDRTVFEFTGPANGYRVEYVEAVLTGGEGFDVTPYTAGAEHLQVVLLAPVYSTDGTVTYNRRLGDHAVNVVRYSTLRDILYAGSYEGYTTFDQGVRARLPFRVTTSTGSDGHGRITVDVAHRWE